MGTGMSQGQAGQGWGGGAYGAHGQAKAGLQHKNNTNPMDIFMLSDHNMGNKVIIASARHLLPFCSAELLGNNLTIVKKFKVLPINNTYLGGDFLLFA